MADYNQIIQKAIDSITSYIIEYDIHEVLNHLELREVSNEVIEELGNENLQKMLIQGTFKVKLSNGNIIELSSIAKHLEDNRIEDTIILENVKYMRYELTKDFTTTQIKKIIRNQLLNNNAIDYCELEKTLLAEELKEKEIVGYIHDLPVKISDSIKDSKIYFQVTGSRENSIKLIHEVIEELKLEETEYINKKLVRDKKNFLYYLSFILIVIGMWVINNFFKEIIPIWVSNILTIILFIVPLSILRWINHSFIQTILFPQKAKIKYSKEFKSN